MRKVALLGVGLLGGSVGLAMRRAGFAGTVVGVGRRRESLDAAMAAGAIDEALLQVSPAVADADLVVLAAPVAAFEKLMGEAADHLSADAVVTDVGSTKRDVVRWAGRFLRQPERFVGAHPVAGSDLRGPQFARADLFDGACCILTPTRRTDPDAARTVTAFWKSLGLWTVRMTPAAHDKALARVSHLPHVVAAALMRLTGPELQELAGPGLVDVTRIAGGDPDLWRDIFMTNRDGVRDAIARLCAELDRFGKLLEGADATAIRKFLADAQRKRRQMIDRKLKGDFFEA